MERLSHRPEIAFEAGGRRCGGVQCVAGLGRRETEQGGGSRGRSERAERGRRVPASLVVVGADRGSECAFEFEADRVRRYQVLAAGVRLLGENGKWRNQRDAGVAVHRPREVVVIKRVARSTGMERPLSRRPLRPDTEHRRGACGLAVDTLGREGRRPGVVQCPGECDADGIEKGTADGLASIPGNVFVGCRRNGVAERCFGRGHGQLSRGDPHKHSSSGS